MSKKFSKKDVLFILLAIAALAVVAFMVMPSKEQKEDLFDLTVMARSSEIVVDKIATEEETLKALVLNTKATVKVNGENVADAFTENAVMDVESMTATENGIFATYTVEEGVVTVEVTYANEATTISFEIKSSSEVETTETTNVKSNYYDVASYALNSSERNIMNSEEGYHYNVTDENGNTIGTVTAEEISGTEAGDAAIAADPNLSYSQTTEGDTWIEANASTPEQSYEVVTDVQEIEKEVVVEQPVVVEEATTEEAPVVDASAAQQEAAAEEAATSEISASSEYADLAILKADGSVVTYFGNGTNHALINEQDGESCFVEDLGNGHVNTCVGIMRY